MKLLAGERFYNRGYKYFTEGAIVRLVSKDESISAKVRGTHDYRVKIWIEEEALEFDCDCPVGMDGEFCKHCVVVGLSWLAQRASSDGGLVGQPVGIDIRSHLMAQDKKALVNLLLERAEEDDLFEQRLHMMAAKKTSKALVVATFRKAMDAAIGPRNFVEYSEMYSYVRGIQVIADSIQGLLKDGHAIEVRELTEYALKTAEEAMNSVDDSDGHMRRILDRFEQLHHSACKLIQPDPKALAKFLFEWEIQSDWEVFYGAAETYADVLGESGLAAYRAFATKEWKHVRPLAPGEDDPERFGRRFRIGKIMERYAQATGEIEALVAIKQQDLSGAFRFLEIAEIYKKAGKSDTAIEWAERGAKLFPEHAGGLNRFLIAEYHATGRHIEAIALTWARFTELQCLGRYQELKKSADYLAQWAVWREKAWKLLRESPAEKQQGSKSRWAWQLASDHSILVEIFLSEQKTEDAWNEAILGGCRKELWLKLADIRSQKHPAEAVEVYLRHIEPTLQAKNNTAYREAVEILGKVKELKMRLGCPEDFALLVETIRTQHKPKRNLMRLFLSEGW